MPNRTLAEQFDRALDTILASRDSVPRVKNPELAVLLRLAADLRGLPAADFKARLKSDFQRSSSMATPAVSPVPEGYRTITPYLAVAEAPKLLEFMQQAFGAVLLYRGTGSAGGMHAEVQLGDSRVMVGGGSSYAGPSYPTAIHLKVDNVDEVYARALAAGAISTLEPRDMEYGERSAGIKDLAGNQWYLATPLAKTHFLPEMGSVTPYLHPRGTAQFIAFLKEAFGAEEVVRAESTPGTIEHAKVRLGNSIIEMGEGHGEYQPMPTMFYMYLADVDAAYARALRAGAKSVRPPEDQPYGDRVAAVEDSGGNQWYIATRNKDAHS